MTNIVSDGININTTQSSSTTQVSLQNDDTKTIQLPSPLVNTLLSFNYTLDGEPVLEGITGTLTIEGQYENGPIDSLGSIDLSSENSFLIHGKYTKVNASLSDLINANTMIIYADQNINIR